MKHWFRALYDSFRNWAHELPARIDRAVERPQVKVERPPERKRALTVVRSASMRPSTARSLGQRRASKRREFIHALRRDV